MLTIALITSILYLAPSPTREVVLSPEKEEDWPVGSAMQVGLAHNKRTDSLNKAISACGAELLELIGEDGGEPDARIREALNTEQLEWFRYRDASCELVGAATGAGGSWPSTYGAECRVVISQRRLALLEACITELRQMEPQARQWEVAKCIGMQDILSTE
jgi:uncharacterized protein YecT (DUF1311 family)